MGGAIVTSVDYAPCCLDVPFVYTDVRRAAGHGAPVANKHLKSRHPIAVYSIVRLIIIVLFAVPIIALV